MGGRVLYPTEIRDSIDIDSYPDFMVEVAIAADKMEEPNRSEKLRAIRNRIYRDLWRNLSRYRECARELRALRKTIEPDAKPEFQEIHCSIGLKRNHLYNDFAQLNIVDRFLAKQPDLFEIL